ncbi:MAG: MATE family efflux transporter, partial [Kiritimatiellae bacterium]|nr:MATE family efflux transporter [Kiritimatiellia bacterium]
GAARAALARSLAWICTGLGIATMTATGALLLLFAPEAMAILTPDPAVQAAGVRVLRIEAFAEPLFAASIVAGGALRGAGDTLVPSLVNLASMWGVRIPLAAWLVARHGLTGAWIAMAVQLCVRGLLLLARLAGFDGRRRV